MLNSHLDHLPRRKFDVRGDAPDHIPPKNTRKPSIAGGDTRISCCRNAPWILTRLLFTHAGSAYWKCAMKCLCIERVCRSTNVLGLIYAVAACGHQSLASN